MVQIYGAELKLTSRLVETITFVYIVFPFASLFLIIILEGEGLPRGEVSRHHFLILKLKSVTVNVAKTWLEYLGRVDSSRMKARKELLQYFNF